MQSHRDCESGDFKRLETKILPQDAQIEREAGPRGAAEPIRTSVELKYRLGERTESQLREMGARCMEESTLTDLYYDTESFQLAAQQTWLSRQAGQWRLIRGQGPNSTVNKAEQLGPRMRAGSQASPVEMCANRAGIEREGESVVAPESLEDGPLPEPKEGSEPLGGLKILPQPLPPPHPQYSEMTTSSAMVEHLARCLQVASTEDEVGETMSVERFVELAGIQNYGCWTVSRRLEFRLPGTGTLEVRKDYTGFPRAHVALLTMGANVLDIGQELEKMESLAAELDLQHRLS